MICFNDVVQNDKAQARAARFKAEQETKKAAVKPAKIEVNFSDFIVVVMAELI